MDFLSYNSALGHDYEKEFSGDGFEKVTQVRTYINQGNGRFSEKWPTSREMKCARAILL
jgi:hypothetical protein